MSSKEYPPRVAHLTLKQMRGETLTMAEIRELASYALERMVSVRESLHRACQ